MARYVLERELARSLHFVPAAVSPFKMDDRPVSFFHRVTMLSRIMQEELPASLRERIRILEIENQRPPPSYTVDTCEAVRLENPGITVGLLMGSDSFLSFHKWKRASEIVEYHPLIVFMREGDDRQETLRYGEELEERFRELSPRILILDNPRVDCSSTHIKARLLEGGKEDDSRLQSCLSPSLLRYIFQEKVYL